MKKTKVTAMILVMLMIFTLLTGCGGNEAPSAEPETPTASAPAESPVETPAAESGEPADEPDAAISDPNLGIAAAKNMNIEYFTDGVKLITDASGQKLLLVPEGVTAPTGLGEDAVVSTPVRASQLWYMRERRLPQAATI